MRINGPVPDKINHHGRVGGIAKSLVAERMAFAGTNTDNCRAETVPMPLLTLSNSYVVPFGGLT
jgi:hypothetical protein